MRRVIAATSASAYQRQSQANLINNAEKIASHTQKKIKEMTIALSILWQNNYYFKLQPPFCDARHQLHQS